MPRAKTPTTKSSNKQVITMPEGGAQVTLRKSGPVSVPTPIDLDVQIRTRAYELYEERGRTAGQENEDWLRAEQEVLARQNQKHSVSA